MVLKSFESADDCQAQFRLLMAAPERAVLRPYELMNAGYSFTMPLALGRTSDYLGICAALRELWKAPATQACSRATYHEYAMSRTPGNSCYSKFAPLFDKLKRETADFYRQFIVDKPIYQNVFVHGDAIVSNFVNTNDGPRAIDLSPRLAPPEIEVDIAKLWLSALGFDVHGPKQRADLASSIALLEKEAKPDQQQVIYYHATHLLRVMAKEPPNDRDRWEFYQRSTNYVF